MATDQQFLTGQQLLEQEGMADWRVLGRTAAAWFAAYSHAAGAALARRISALDGEHQGPDVDVRSTGV